MSEKLYIDTNVIIDVIEDRKNAFGKDISTPSFDVFLKASNCKYYLIISSWTLFELRKRCSADMAFFFSMLKKKILKVEHTSADEESAKNRSKENFADAIHLVIAERLRADYIITRNVADFEKIGTKIPIKKPEWLI